jgi:hypothetical protein
MEGTRAFLLEDGPVKDALRGFAEHFALPAPTEAPREPAETPRESPPPVTAKRFEHPAKSAEEQLAALKNRGWLK